MAESEYRWLSDREQAYLDDPESFDPQERAEIRHRLREKYRGTVDDINFLSKNPELWDKKVAYDDRDWEYVGEDDPAPGTVRGECLVCGRTRLFDRYMYVTTGATTVRHDGGWRDLRRVMVSDHPDGATPEEIMARPHRYVGWCGSCWEDMRDWEAVVETGRVECARRDCSTHKIAGEVVRKHVGAVAYTEDELDRLEDEWEEARHHVCPDCGKPQDELTEESWEGRVQGVLIESDGFVCECGWRGFESDLSFVKK